MLGNIALDVVIGLVFTYLLYSLYATVIMELISSSLGLRARNLCYAIKRMLRDEEEFKDEPVKKFFARFFTSIIQTAGRSLNLKEGKVYKDFFEQSTIKYLSSGGMHNKPSYIRADSFVKGLIETIKSDDEEITMVARIEQGLDEKLKDNPETQKHIRSLLHQANNDLVKFNILLEQWYNDTMERATGWFKRSTQILLLFIGAFIAVACNVDTLAIIRKLSKDRQAREQMVELATRFSENNQGLIDNVKSKATINDTAKTVNQRLDSLNAIRKTLEKDISDAQTILSSNWAATLGEGECDCWGNRLTHVWKNIWGYLLTVLALSLGAPFWFDLLNKLVKLRSSKAIGTPSDSGGSPNTTSPDANRSILNRAG